MMSDAPVVFDKVWKKFWRGERHDSLRDLVPAIARRLAGRTASSELAGDQEFEPGLALFVGRCPVGALEEDVVNPAVG